MSRALSFGITFISCLTLGGCSSGPAKLTEGKAAGAGIGALLGLGDSADDPDEESVADEAATRAKPVHFFGPAQ